MGTNSPLPDSTRNAELSHPFESDLSFIPREEIDMRNPAKLLEFVSGVVSYRIEFPKVLSATPGKKAVKQAKPAKQLSPWDKQEIKGACAQAISQLGNWSTGEVPWKDCFNFSRKAIGLTRDAENARCTIRLDGFKESADGSKVRLVETIAAPFALSLLSPLPDLESDAIRRENLARNISSRRRECFTAHGADHSRKRRAALRGHLATLRMIAFGNLRYRGMTEKEISATCMRVARLNEYAAKGAEILQDRRLSRSEWMTLDSL